MEIGAAWARFIAGFDTTRHDISNIEVQLNGRTARASANVIASHWLDNEKWVIRGAYSFQLMKPSDDWVVDNWKFILKSKSGDRSLVDIAEARASASGANDT